VQVRTSAVCTNTESGYETKANFEGGHSTFGNSTHTSTMLDIVVRARGITVFEREFKETDIVMLNTEADRYEDMSYSQTLPSNSIK
jgi:hypothetical protein